jgi:hypothetical protein
MTAPAGVLLNSGKNDIVGVYFKSTAVHSNLYLGLMNETSSPALTAQIGSGITEVTGTGYARIPIVRGTDWTIVNNLATAAAKTFTIGSGGWTAVNGYFIAISSDGADAIIAEAFAPQRQGDKLEGDTVEVIAEYEQKDSSE